jgi:hypothetical protein
MDPSEASPFNDDLRGRLAEHEGWSPAEYKTWDWLSQEFAERHLDPYLIGPDAKFANVFGLSVPGETSAPVRGEPPTPILDAVVRLARQVGIEPPPLGAR